MATSMCDVRFVFVIEHAMFGFVLIRHRIAAPSPPEVFLAPQTHHAAAAATTPLVYVRPRKHSTFNRIIIVRVRERPTQTFIMITILYVHISSFVDVVIHLCPWGECTLSSQSLWKKRVRTKQRQQQQQQQQQ